MGKRPAVFVKSLGTGLRDGLLDFFFGRTGCPACGAEGPGLCALCRSEIRSWGRFKSEAGEGVAMFHYSGAARELIYGFKKRLSFDALDALCQIMDDWLKDNALPDGELIVPVPSTRANRKLRGFDPGFLLAEHLARRTQLPLCDCLINHSRKEHKSLSYSGRLSASRDAFTLRPGALEAIRGKRVLLFDDIMTTGATIRAVTRLLEEHGAASVLFVVLQRATA